MTAIHLSAPGLTSDWAAVTIDTTLKRLAGVAKVAVVRSLGLVSVLFDERRSSPEQIMRAVQAAGVEVHPYRTVR